MVQFGEVVKNTHTNVKIKRDSCGATPGEPLETILLPANHFTTRRALYDVPRQSIAFVLEQEWKRFHFSEIIGRLPYLRATVTDTHPSDTLP